MTFQNKNLKYLFLIFLLVCFLAFAVVIPVNAAFIPSLENAIHILTNQERTAEGLSPLLSESRLVNMARQHSEEMATLDYFSHTSPVPGYEELSDRADKSGITDWRRIGENIGYLDGAPEERMAEIIVEAWMDSSGHRENILDDTFTHLGVGVFEINGEYYFTQNFGAFYSDPSVSSSSQYSSSNSSNNNQYPRTSFSTGFPFATGFPYSSPSFYAGTPYTGTPYAMGSSYIDSSLGAGRLFGGSTFGVGMPFSGTYLGTSFPFNNSSYGAGSTFSGSFPIGGRAYGLGSPFTGTFLGNSIPFKWASYERGLPYNGTSFGMGLPFNGMSFGRGTAFNYGFPFGGYTFY